MIDDGFPAVDGIAVLANMSTGQVDIDVEGLDEIFNLDPDDALNLARELMRAAFALGAEGTPKEPEAEGGE